MRTRRDTERGAMLPIVLGGMLLLATLAYGGFTLLRIVVARNEVQRVADAAVLIATNIVKHEGLPFDALKQGRAQEIAQKNTGAPIQFQWDPVEETPDKVKIVVHVSAQVATPAFVFKQPTLEVSATATGTANQKTISDAEKKYPRLVLVLDYSGSMQRGLGGAQVPQNQDSYHVLLRAVNMLLDFNYDIKYGLVVYSDTNLATLSVALGSIGQVRAVVNDSYDCPYSTNRACTTGTAGALKSAFDLLNDSNDEARYVMLVSDGQPSQRTDGSTASSIAQAEDDARGQAARLWDIGATIFTLHVVNLGGAGATALQNFMVSVSGPPENRGDANYYANAASEEEMKRQFKRFGAAIACQIGPLTPVPPHPEKMHIFVKAPGGEETAILDSTRIEGVTPAANPGDLWDDTKPFYTGNYFFYNAAKAVIYVTPSVCDRVLELKEPVIVRYASPQLTE